jgi:hypothetical protein
MKLRRPPLTRKKIDLILVALMWADAQYRDEQEEYPEENKAIQEATDFVRRLSRWHRWKQEQKGNENA